MQEPSNNDGDGKKPAKEEEVSTPPPSPPTQSEEQHHVTGVESTTTSSNANLQRRQQQQEQDLQKLKEVTKASTTVAASATRRPNSANWTVSATAAPSSNGASATTTSTTTNASITGENLPPVPRKKSSMLQKQKDNRSTRSITTEDLASSSQPRHPTTTTAVAAAASSSKNRAAVQLQNQKSSSRSTRSITTGDLKRVAAMGRVSSSRTMTMTGSIIHSAYHQHSVISDDDDGAIATVGDSQNNNNGSASISMMTASFNDSLPTQDGDDTLLPQPGSSRNFNDSLPTHEDGDDTLLPQPGSSRIWSSSRNFNSSAAGSEFAVPGAIAIAGIDARQNGNDLDDLEDNIIVTSGEADDVQRGEQEQQEQQIPEQHPREQLVEALPISGDDEDYLRALKDTDDEEQAASNPLSSNIVAARPVLQREHKSTGFVGWIQRHKLLTTTTILVVIAVIVTSVFGTEKDANNKGNKSGFGSLKLSKRFKQALPIITNITSEDILYDTRTPQYKALLWLADYDKAQLDFSMSSGSNNILVMEGGGNKPRILQRYILAVLFFATQGRYWNTTYGFLSEWDECQWATYDTNGDVVGVASCNGDGLVTSLLLGTCFCGFFSCVLLIFSCESDIKAAISHTKCYIFVFVFPFLYRRQVRII